MDPRPHRNRAAAHRRRGTNHRRSGRAGRAARHRSRRRASPGHRLHCLWHDDAGSGVPQLRRAAAGAARLPRRRGVQRRDGVRGFRLCAGDRGQICKGRRGALRAGGGRGDALAHHRLERPLHGSHLCRWRGRGGAAAGFKARNSLHASARRWRFQGHALLRHRRIQGIWRCEARHGDHHGGQ